MQLDNLNIRKILSKDLLDVFIRIGLLVFLVTMCARIIGPFLNIGLWSVVLAIALYPLHKAIAAKMGGSHGRSATVLVLLGLLLIGTPTVMLGSSFAEHVYTSYTNFQEGTIEIEPPKESIQQWPLVGEQVYTLWSSAAGNMPDFIHQNRQQLSKLSKRVLEAAATTAGGLMLFLGSLIIAGIIMAYGESGSRAMGRIISRFAGSDLGPQLQKLTTATVRSVAIGVIGVAFIQALVLGVGFLFAGVPAAGVLALLVMVLGILQAPALLLTVPVITYIWMVGDASTTMNMVYTAYLVIGGFVDQILKPILLGRGVDVPMPIILLGALGGMLTGGIVGLFIGAVLLAVGYELFMTWVAHGDPDPSSEFASAKE
jgi:predicted PurR-regulated permease PerM